MERNWPAETPVVAVVIDRRGRDFSPLGIQRIDRGHLPVEFDRATARVLPPFFYEVSLNGRIFAAEIPDPTGVLVEVPVEHEGRRVMRTIRAEPPTTPHAASLEPSRFALVIPAELRAGTLEFYSQDYDDFCGTPPPRRPIRISLPGLRELPPIAVRPPDRVLRVPRDSLPISASIVLTGDGYTADEKQLFFDDCNTLVQHFRTCLPQLPNTVAVNFLAFFEASQESGADKSDACSAPGGVWRTTAYESGYGMASAGPGADACKFLYGDPTGPGQLKYANGSIAFVCLVNDGAYGGAGTPGQCWYAARHADALEIAMHELGHAFGLREEYENTGQGFGSSAQGPNVSDNPGNLPWVAQVPTIFANPNQTCPNPDGWPVPVLADAGKVAAFEGANLNTCGWFRPTLNCKMRELNQPFCSVCQDAIAARMKELAGQLQPVP